MIYGVRFRIDGQGLTVQGLHISGLGFRVLNLGSRV
jgi:hypothetical protein